MDRDNRWDRTSKAYDLLTNPEFEISKISASEVLNENYQKGITDEFLEPVRLTPTHFQEGDGLIMFNFRPDRARQLIKAITVEEFDGFKRKHQPKINAVTFTQYEAKLPVEIAFPPESLND